jgi:hypothetical protein
MNQLDNDTKSVRHAESAVDSSINRFESAMEHLADRVEDTSHKLQHVMDLVERQQDELLHLKDRAKQAIEPMRPYIAQLQRNPRPYILGAVSFVAALFALTYIGKRRQRGVYHASDVEIPESAPGELVY